MRIRLHGWRAGEGEDRQRKRHMWTVPPRGSPILDALAHGAASPPLSSSPNSTTFFSQDGRKVGVGDCALFKPPRDSPPFIGIIRSVTAIEENKLTLSVTWLYRPAEVKLGKGPLEAAPNEIFYSFHKDEIPAASLLHPCKVAFLPKGVELPSGIGSFVCRKVYDITKQCLWWLTDKDFMTDRQEEIDQLLHKTRVEMHATVPPGGRSPKPMNGPTSTSQLKPGSDGVQNSASSHPPQVKGKKRERGDQGSESVKRERSSRMEDGDSGHNRSDCLKSEIAKFTDKGGLVDYDGVEKLVQLMMPEKKIDLVCRSVLAGVVAATDKLDCLNWFVQLKGLPVYDEWLQEVHKGKIGDGNSPKDGDRSIEEFLLILLRALDKLPINLHALQMCNIGKSVNHLCTHKNLEIQKKARSLVDTWKKRVEAEMDAKPNQGVSWPARCRLPEVTPGGNRQSGGSSEVAVKSLVMQPTASKTASVKLVPGETTAKSAFASPVFVKSVPSPTSVGTNLKDGQSRNYAVGGAIELPSNPAKDETSAEPSLVNQHLRGSVPSQPTVSSLRVDNSETGNISSWSSTGKHSAISIPSILPDRAEQPFPIVATGGPQRMLGPPTAATPFSPDVFRGSVLSSSPAVTFPSTSFQYPVFPFGNSFPLPSATFSGGSATYVDASSGGRLCFPGVNSQLLGPAGAVSSHYPRPYVVNLADGSNSVGAESSRKWGRQVLDPNAGPGGPDIEGRDEMSSLALRQLSVASSHAQAEEQARMYHIAGGILKRREPEGGWDGCKQSSWQ